MILFHQSFKKAYRKRPASVRKHFDERLLLFEQDPSHQLLNNHALQGKWSGYRSINVTGDFRAVFKELADGSVVFVDIDTHHNLYGT